MRRSRRFISALAGLALAIPALYALMGLILAIPALLWLMESRPRPATLEIGRPSVATATLVSRPADSKRDSRPAAVQRLHSIPDLRMQGAQGETPTFARTLQSTPRFHEEPARQTGEDHGERFFDPPASAQRVEEPDAALPIELDVPELAPGALSFHPTGFDPAAPGALTLWRIGEEGFARLAETISGAEGDFDFGSILIPIRGIALAATAHGIPPTPEAMRGALSVRSELPLPRIEWLEPEDAGFSFEVHTSIGEGSVVLADAEENLIARFEVSSDSPSPRRSARLAIDLVTDEDVVWIAHELPNGRSSRWLILRLDTRESEPEVEGP